MWHSVKLLSVSICILVIQWKLNVSWLQDSTDAVPSDPSDRDQPNGDAPSLPLTVPATDDEVLEVLSPKRTVTPRTPTPREQMENLMREILEDACAVSFWCSGSEKDTGKVYETWSVDIYSLYVFVLTHCFQWYLMGAFEDRTECRMFEIQAIFGAF